jgi:hypothetical protein
VAQQHAAGPTWILDPRLPDHQGVENGAPVFPRLPAQSDKIARGAGVVAPVKPGAPPGLPHQSGLVHTREGIGCSDSERAEVGAE